MSPDCLSIDSKSKGPVSEYEIQSLTRRLARYLDSFGGQAERAERVGGSGHAA
jgi:hypothetical protein